MGEEFREWVEKYCWPISQAGNGRSATKAWELLELAKANLPSSQEQPLEWENYAMTLIWHQHIVHSNFTPMDQLVPIFEDHLVQLSNSQTTTVGEQQRLKVLLCLRLDGATNGYHQLTKQEITDLLSQIEVGQTNAVIWHYICPWAFKHRDVELLAKAVEVMLDKQIYLQDAAYRRADLMHALITGSATREMVIRYVDLMTEYTYIKEFADSLLPVADELGLVDDAMRGNITESMNKFAESDLENQA